MTNSIKKTLATLVLGITLGLSSINCDPKTKTEPIFATKLENGEIIGFKHTKVYPFTKFYPFKIPFITTEFDILMVHKPDGREIVYTDLDSNSKIDKIKICKNNLCVDYDNASIDGKLFLKKIAQPQYDAYLNKITEIKFESYKL
ncbi:MAG: hypothetical protein PHD81_03865 [Candidatus Nanoarchaeia archaeon]|nr:hypothetical protein [Candidatus Nanoarchaeia archaeon]MDD5588219.1 hypothetical protein [Candidatus Nanoarchaeia archaeon]